MRRIVLIGFFIFSALISLAQQDSIRINNADSVNIRAETPSSQDSLVNALNDLNNIPENATAKVDTTRRKTRQAQEGDIETTINYKATDSIFFDLENQNISMYGDTHIDYGDISLDSDRTDVNWYDQTITSQYTVDSTGRKVGKPIFTDREEVYETENILYNFKNKRAVIRGVVTEQDGAFMHGEDVRKNESDELFIRRARYTTCNLADPHFFIEAAIIKVIPSKKILAGPSVLKFRSTEGKSIFTPLALPFAMFPQPKSKVSGVIFPSYGEENRRGFFLRNGGYYWAMSDYADLRITGDIYSKGGAGFEISSNYKKRYAFSGSFSYSFNRTITDDVEGGAISNDTWVRWSHRPETRGNSSFSASVSLGSSSYSQNQNLVNQDFQRSINARFTSNLSYQQRFRWSSLSINARQNQNISTGIMNVTAPEVTFNVNRVNPFKKIVRNSRSPLSKLNFSHNFVARSEFSNAPISSSGLNIVNTSTSNADTLDFFNDLDRVFSRGRYGGRHTIPVSTSFSFLKYFTVTPSFNYQELWYTQELDWSYNDELQGLEVDTVRKFSRASSWRSSMSINTILYGTYFIKGKRIEAIRHVITPSISVSYNPDFGDPSRGIFQDVQIDETGRTRRLSKYEGFIYGSPPGGESQSLGFRLQNNLEMKVRNLKDTTGNEFKKIKIFDNLSFGTGYNFAADSFQLSNITFQARTSFLKRAIGVNFSGTIDPYIYNLISESTSASGNRTVVQERVNRFAWDNGEGIGQLSRFSTNVTLTLSPQTFKRGGNNTSGSGNRNQQDTQARGADLNNTSFFDDPSLADDIASPDQLQPILNNPDQYVDFNLPWRLNANYAISRTKTGFRDSQINQTLSFGGSVALTPKTQVSFNSGYDLQGKEFTTTRINVARDLHCWTLSFNVVPFGRFQSFNLTIQPRSSLLQELKIERRRNFLDFFN